MTEYVCAHCGTITTEPDPGPEHNWERIYQIKKDELTAEDRRRIKEREKAREARAAHNKKVRP